MLYTTKYLKQKIKVLLETIEKYRLSENTYRLNRFYDQLNRCRNILRKRFNNYCDDIEDRIIDDSIKIDFIEFKNTWLEETQLESSMDKITNHPAYQFIIEMGIEVVPLIIKDLETDPKHWGPALFAITGANPVPKEHAGRVKMIAEDWIQWAKENGYYK